MHCLEWYHISINHITQIKIDVIIERLLTLLTHNEGHFLMKYQICYITGKYFDDPKEHGSQWITISGF